MKRFPFNKDWLFYKVGREEERHYVTLPHDAMLAEKRTPNSSGGAHISWFEGGDYVYEKSFLYRDGRVDGVELPESGRAVLEFEGVYHNAEVYLNDEKVAARPYGYTNFYVDLTDRLLPGGNCLRVLALNAKQPNSRWYTGSGIYRPVNLYILPAHHIELDGVKIKTVSCNPPVVEISVQTNDAGEVAVDIHKKGEQKARYTAHGETEGCLTLSVPLPNAALWSPETPNLYVCRVRFADDTVEIPFGVRVVECTPEKGFCINGRRVILRGACIHHDNGLLGAIADPFAEARKVSLLKQAGYNALRSAHNPCSRALLDACDEAGMLVLDEYIDMWYIHKTKYDYTDYFERWWRQDLSDMVNKDYNHPSVVMYCIGNEVAETSQPRGIELVGQMTRFLHGLDDTRKVTCGINIFFNYLFSLGFGVYSDKKAEKAARSAKVKNSAGSEFYNNLAGLAGSSFMKFGATLHGSDVKTRDAFANVDIAGYNYGIRRYRKDLKKYPGRILLGTETFCSDTFDFWEMAKEHPALIGDFVWAGVDYIGEAGIGAWEYKDYAPDFAHGAGWLTAGSGRIDITGKVEGRGEVLYTRVAYELADIGMAVVPVMKKKTRHSPSAWKHTNAIASWSFNGLDGADASVEVYTRADRVELYLDGEKIAAQKRGRDCRIVFKTQYRAGTLEARAFDKQGRQVAKTALRTAGEETRLTLLPERETVGTDELCYVRLCYTDAQGTVKPLARGRIDVEVENGALLGLGHACSYNADGYCNAWTDTYYGEAMAIIRPDGKGDVRLKARSPFGKAEAAIPLR